MSSCPRCQTELGCSCQLRTASDGTQVCNECIENYEIWLKAKKRKESENNQE